MFAANMTYTNGHSNGGVNGQFKPVNPGKHLRQLLEDNRGIIVAPGVYDGFSARIALEVGFDCIYMVSMLYSHLPGFLG
jgi:2-methylisocitrate lyase-like PEP mutase family enzyme